MALRAIFLGGLILALAGSAFADKGGIPNANSNGKGKGDAVVAAAPEIDFRGSLKYEVLLIGGGGILLLERRRRRRRLSDSLRAGAPSRVRSEN